MKILFLTLFDNNGASSRVRVFQYLPFLEKQGIECKVISTINYKLSAVLSNPSAYSLVYRTLYKFIYNRFLRAIKYLYLIVLAPDYDLVFIQKVPMGIWFFRLLLWRNNNIFFDCDDSLIYLDKKADLISRMKLFFKNRSIVYTLTKSRVVIVGNRYLENIYRNYNRNIVTIPTAVNLGLFAFNVGAGGHNTKVTIGWSGMGEYHIRHLNLLAQGLLELQKSYDFRFKLIGARDCAAIRNIFSKLSDIDIIDWVEPAKVPKELAELDIAVMPLVKDAESQGKCGLKILEYMAIGIPVVCSPVGANCDIIRDGENGYLAADKEEWVRKLSELIKNRQLRALFIKNGRLTVEKKYSCQVVFPAWLNLLKNNKSLSFNSDESIAYLSA